MLNGGLILPAAVTEASPIFMPARLLQLAASACPVPNEWKASQTKAADVVRCADRMVSLLPNIFYEILRLATVRLAALQIKGIAARRWGANWKTRIAFQRDRYRAAMADENAWVRARRPKRCKLANNPRLRRTVVGKLRSNWSPEQIAGWLKRAYPENEHYHVSHETIYRSLYIQTRGVLKKELLRHLRSKRTMRRPRRVGDRRGQIVDLVSISQRPATVEDRAVPGHWEGDLLSGPKNSYIATLVERHTRYVTLAKVANKDTQTVVSALIRQAKTIPNELYKSLTWDRGKELADHRRFTLATNIDVYFCDPQSPWQRGSNENTNGLLRQYFPKGTDLSVYSQTQLNRVARQLNERPRKTLGFATPAERFNACVASIA